METRPYVSWKLIGNFMTDAFKAVGVPEEDAKLCADVLMESDRRGIESHGVNRFKPIYIDRINKLFLYGNLSKCAWMTCLHEDWEFWKKPQQSRRARSMDTRVAMPTLTRPGIMKLWLSRYLPMTVVPLRSKFTVAMSEG